MAKKNELTARMDIAFPLRPMCVENVDVSIDVTGQAIKFRLPGGEVFRTALWFVLEDSNDRYGRSFQEVLEKNYEHAENTD